MKKKLEVEPTEAELVRLVFRLYLSSKGAVEVAKELNAAGHRYRRKLFDRDKVLKIVSNPAVIGEARWGRRNSRTGERRADDEVVVVACPAIISRETFERAQTERRRRDPGRNPGRASSSPLLLTGLVVCGRCGEKYELQTAGKRRPDGTPYRYYQCRRARRSSIDACPGRPHRVDVLDGAVLDFLATRLFSTTRCREILRDLVEEQGILRHRAAEERRRWQNEQRDLSRRRDRLVDAIESNDVPGPSLHVRVIEVEERLTDVEEKLATVSVIHATPSGLYDQDTVARFQAALRTALLADESTARTYVRGCVEEVVVGAGGAVEIAGKHAAVTSEPAKSAAGKRHEDKH